MFECALIHQTLEVKECVLSFCGNGVNLLSKHAKPSYVVMLSVLWFNGDRFPKLLNVF